MNVIVTLPVIYASSLAYFPSDPRQVACDWKETMEMLIWDYVDLYLNRKQIEQ